MAEALFNDHAARWFRAYSAGSRPVGRVHPFALEQIAGQGIPNADFRSKTWLEFTPGNSPALDFVITVCDAAARESCPFLTGSPLRVHWSLPDPAAAAGGEGEIQQAFADCFATLAARVQRLAQIDLDAMSPRQIADAMQALSGDMAGLGTALVDRCAQDQLEDDRWTSP